MMTKSQLPNQYITFNPRAHYTSLNPFLSLSWDNEEENYKLLVLSLKETANHFARLIYTPFYTLTCLWPLSNLFLDMHESMKQEDDNIAYNTSLTMAQVGNPYLEAVFEIILLKHPSILDYWQENPGVPWEDFRSAAWKKYWKDFYENPSKIFLILLALPLSLILTAYTILPIASVFFMSLIAAPIVSGFLPSLILAPITFISSVVRTILTVAISVIKLAVNILSTMAHALPKQCHLGKVNPTQAALHAGENSRLLDSNSNITAPLPNPSYVDGQTPTSKPV